MTEIQIDLTKIKFDGFKKPLFEDEVLSLKNINFIFAKNGSGKSTLTDAIKNQKSKEFDIHIFKGFESVLGEDEKLDAFSLTIDAGKNQEKIDTLEDEKSLKEESLKQTIKISGNLNELEEGTLLYKKRDAERILKEKQKKFNNFLTQSGTYIASQQNPVLTKNQRGYNKNSFEKDIKKKKRLEESEILMNKNILKEETKTLQEVKFSIIDYSNYLFSVNEILLSEVKEKTRIVRLNSKEKINFAQDGLNIHHHDNNNICAFCGNKLTEDVIEELENFFSADEVKHLEERITKEKSLILAEIKRLENLNLISNDFYSTYIDEAIEEVKVIEKKKESIKLFLDLLLKSLDKKEKNLFSKNEKLSDAVPDSISLDKFNELINKNNQFSQNLAKEQEKARSNLRYHEIYKLLEKNNYEVVLNDLHNAEDNLEKSKKDFERLQNEQKDLKKDISLLEGQILSLKPRSEKEAMNRINKKLRLRVPWELDFFENEESGYYHIKQDETYRGIKQLSTGEKNIIAFLYFIEKLEVINNTDSKKKIIIFDDPMSSNDDTMQYLIIWELQRLYQGKDKRKFVPDRDFFVILTHNVHFYLNVQDYGNFKDKKLDKKDIYHPKIKKISKYDKHNYYRIQNKSFFLVTSEKDDFKTSYEGLWIELKDLYNCGHKNSMLNSMRRIIETYTEFNSIDKLEFYKDNGDYLKLFNVNSHSLGDLLSETFTEDKEQMKELFEQIFHDNNADAHFIQHWK